ncbi:hypothetical protein K435DRAFT_791891 [Dendrothele bispora CBS 962.96]|uniref:Uncharacterized protein n=1 Tax=Dendrothele bispora (strain CBS 962.96) TaxID=1314807 RepID=A0A4S8MKN2_DENBC|nr:hypothetical protein K435DRAFT_791891 [Dendrothele bispora CBS 962.96]
MSLPIPWTDLNFFASDDGDEKLGSPKRAAYFGTISSDEEAGSPSTVKSAKRRIKPSYKVKYMSENVDADKEPSLSSGSESEDGSMLPKASLMKFATNYIAFSKTMSDSEESLPEPINIVKPPIKKVSNNPKKGITSKQKKDVQSGSDFQVNMNTSGGKTHKRVLMTPPQVEASGLNLPINPDDVRSPTKKHRLEREHNEFPEVSTDSQNVADTQEHSMVHNNMGDRTPLADISSPPKNASADSNLMLSGAKPLSSVLSKIFKCRLQPRAFREYYAELSKCEFYENNLRKALAFESYNIYINPCRTPSSIVRAGRFLDCAMMRSPHLSNQPAVLMLTGLIVGEALDGTGGFDPTRNISLQLFRQEYQIFEAWLGTVMSKELLCGPVKKGILVISTKRESYVPKVDTTSPSKSAMDMFGGTSQMQQLDNENPPFLKYSDEVHIYDGRANSERGITGFRFKPKDFDEYKSLPELTSRSLKAGVLVTVGCTVSGPWDLNTFSQPMIALNLLFVIVLAQASPPPHDYNWTNYESGIETDTSVA